VRWAPSLLRAVVHILGPLLILFIPWELLRVSSQLLTSLVKVAHVGAKKPPLSRLSLAQVITQIALFPELVESRYYGDANLEARRADSP
jgi:hypothetical protein